MRCISLHQPWASLVAIGAKQFETRSFATSHRGPLLIHAAKKWNRDLESISLSAPFNEALSRGLPNRDSGRDWNGVIYDCGLHRGCIIGAVELVECYRVAHNPPRLDFSGVHKDGRRYCSAEPMPTGDERAFGNFDPGRYAWKLANPRRFATPIPFTGRQGFFNVPDEVVAEQMKNTMPTGYTAAVGD